MHLKITGVLLLMLGLLHVIFPRYFKWKQDLAAISMINRQMMYVHAFFIGLVVLLMGWLCLDSAHIMISTVFGKKICLGFGVFWTARLFIQFFGYSPALWKGKKFETGVHVIFSLLWIYFSVIFYMAYLL